MQPRPLLSPLWPLLLAALIGGAECTAARAQNASAPRLDPETDTTSVELPDSLSGPPSSIGAAQVTSFAAEQSTYRPYRQEPSVYLSAPAVRYNRVEGAVVGLQRRPPGWSTKPGLVPFGQVSYSLGLRDWRAVVGLEAVLVSPDRGTNAYGLKAGLHAARTTATEDDWKRSWEENSVSALVFGQDLFNYYGLRGVTGYLVQRVARQLRVTVGTRWAEHEYLPRTTEWALLDRSGARPNPSVDEGELRTAIVSIEGGRLVRRSETRSVGTIARVHAEIGRGWRAPLDYNRLIVDLQSYQPVTRSINLNVRGRAGITTTEAPVQLKFRADGVRGLRTFQPSIRASERMLLGGAAAVWHNAAPDGWTGSSELRIFGDVGWFGDEAPPGGDTFAFVGLGGSAFDGILSIEVAWPVHETPDRTVPHWRPQTTVRVNPLR